jgi:glycosyltransferase involved in cell wall biosynthesis
MWNVLRDYIETLKIRVWIHGSEIHQWHRRSYNYINEQQILNAKKEGLPRERLWREILNSTPKNLKFIFVSKTFSEEIMEDYSTIFNDSQYKIIHNPINTNFFLCSPKNVEHRKKILSIRPFSSRQYANDLTVKAILELSKLKIFNELEFLIIGDGILFDETIEPLHQFSNVKIEKKFLNQHEIVSLHEEYGIFLCPTRWDSHGVSRDEAMSSGLVPVTTKIAAIPEFVDDSSAILTDPENFIQISKAIERLFYNPELFLRMSEQARKVVLNGRSQDTIIENELNEIL